jgi:hypothetical protein
MARPSDAHQDLIRVKAVHWHNSLMSLRRLMTKLLHQSSRFSPRFKVFRRRWLTILWPLQWPNQGVAVRRIRYFTHIIVIHLLTYSQGPQITHTAPPSDQSLTHIVPPGTEPLIPGPQLGWAAHGHRFGFQPSNIQLDPALVTPQANIYGMSHNAF